MSKSPVILWFRNDLRLHDNPALRAAADAGRPVIPVYLKESPATGFRPRGAASNWWLHHALHDLAENLSNKGSRLILLDGGDPLETFSSLLKQTGAGEIWWNRRYDPLGVKVDTALKKKLPAKSFRGNLLFEPHEVETQSGDFYKVYTPFFKAVCAKGPPQEPLPEPRELPAPDAWPASKDLEDWNLLPSIPWDAGFHDAWDPTASGARRQAKSFLAEAAGEYKKQRDFPARPSTSRVSPYLHFGQISSRALWHDAREAEDSGDVSGSGVEAWLRQLVWRDFATHLLFHQPQLETKPMQAKFAGFPWESNKQAFRVWSRGQTGYPIVDAGMRELWATGWMHNRVRMITASFLVKDLLLHWREGEAWFWDTLVDADPANNIFGWQWTAGCGADAAPYFRIFNPILQSKKFDPDGAYIRKWVPELRDMDSQDIHAPWESKNPPKNYPPPMVDHAKARDRALEALSSLG